MTIKDLEINETAIIKTVGGSGALRQHFLDMGVIPGTRVTPVKYAPMGDPLEIRIHGYELTLRVADAAQIEVETISSKNAGKPQTDSSLQTETPESADETGTARTQNSTVQKKQGALQKKPSYHKEHPGLGEGGKYHEKKTENPLPKETKLTFALAGNQNCGKTTLFNQLTGANQHVGNFPGVTVDQKSGSIKGKPNTLVTDLPGIYSLSPYSAEEIVSRSFILEQKPTCIINIVDATNIERNLYLTMQLMTLETPVVLALNMMDEMHGNGGSVDINVMEDFLGIPVVPISAAKNEGIDELINHAIHIAQYQEKPADNDFCLENENGGALHRCLHAIMNLIDDHAKAAAIPVRFAATKLVEGDAHIMDALKLSTNEKEMLEHIICQLEEERGLDRAAAIADMRFSFIKKLVAAAVKKPKESRERERSRRIDKFLTGKYTAIPAFIGVMSLVFFLTFNVIGAWLQELLEAGIDKLTALVATGLQTWNVNPALQSLVIDGVFTGVGSVLSFLPIIVTLFFFLSLLEDTGYMARVAFVMDKLLRKIGLSGRSIVPMLIGFGCTVPGVMASRTLPSERDRKMTILLTPFMSCTAKLPVYAFFSTVFFPKYSGLVMVGLYFLGIITGILIALLLKNTAFKGEAVPFVMELPNYRMPGLKNVAQLLWEKAKDFLQRAFTIIFLASIIIWFMQTFDTKLNMVTDSHDSILALIAGYIAPIFKPLGFGDWRISTSLLVGVIAKESVVSTLSVLFSSEAALVSLLSSGAAAALLVFCLLYSPCVAAIASIKRELGTKWAAFVVVGQCALAWLVAFGVKLISLAFA